RRADLHVVGPGLHAVEGEGAVGAGRRRPGTAAVRFRQLHGDSGQAELAALDLAWRAAAGLEVTPDDAADLIRGRCRRGRLLRALRHGLRPDAGEPEQRD